MCVFIGPLQHLLVHPLSFLFSWSLKMKSLSSVRNESPSSNSSLDHWPTFLGKRCIDILLPSLNKLVNLSLQKGVFPKPFKNAIVTPLIKKTSLSKEDPQNYWLVSRLSFLPKLVVYSCCSYIRSHVDSNDLGNTFQSAYKAGHSMETACCVLRMRYTCLCPRVCSQPLSSSTYQPPLTPSTMTHFSAPCRQGLALLVQSLGGLQHISWIVLNLSKLAR